MGFFDRYQTPADLPQRIPVFPLSGALLLPRADLPLNIFEPRYLEMVSDALAGSRLIGMIQPEEDKADIMGRPPLCRIGCAGRITSYMETPDSRLLVTLTGICRFAVSTELVTVTAYRQVQPDYAPFEEDLTRDFGQEAVDRETLLATFKNYLEANGLKADWEQVAEASNETLVNTLSLIAPYPPRDKQALLEAQDLKSRADVLVALTEMSLARQSGGPGRRLQ